jgi:hypothetical protein
MSDPLERIAAALEAIVAMKREDAERAKEAHEMLRNATQTMSGLAEDSAAGIAISKASLEEGRKLRKQIDR